MTSPAAVIKQKKITIIFTIIVAITFLLSLFSYSLKMVPQSDDATSLLVAQDFLKGNIMLKDWYLPPDSYYTSLLPFYYIYVHFRGIDIAHIFFAPTILFILLIIISLLLSIYSLPQIQKKHSAIITLLIIAFLSVPILNTELRGYRTGTLFLIFLSIIALQTFLNSRNKIYLITYLLISTLALIGDPSTVSLSIAPIILIFGFRLVKEIYNIHNIDHASFFIFSLSILITIASYSFINIFNGILGGFAITQTFLNIVEPQHFIGHITFILELIPQSLGISFSNHSNLILNIIDGVGHIAFLSLILITFILLIKKNFNKMDFISMFLVLGILTQFAFMFLTPYASEKYAIIRYLTPIYIYFGILCGRLISQLLINNSIFKNILYFMSILIGILYFIDIYNVIEIPYPSQNYYSTPPKSIITLLYSNHLINGYGTYYNASIITTDTNSNIKVRPIEIVNQTALRYNFLSKGDSWYNTYGNFFLFDDISANTIRPKFSIKDVYETFGKPTTVYNMGIYHLYIWNYNITPYIFRIVNGLKIQNKKIG